MTIVTKDSPVLLVKDKTKLSLPKILFVNQWNGGHCLAQFLEGITIMQLKNLGVIAALAILCAFTIYPANAQLARSALEIYEEGPVWHMIKIRTASGKREVHLDSLSRLWRKQVKLAEKMGFVLKHHVLTKWPHDESDWDVMIIEVFPNMAAYDEFWQNWAKVDAAILPSRTGETEAMTNLAEFRTFQGVEISREVFFLPTAD